METSGIITQILSSAGFAGAILIVLGWAYWKKDKSEKATQVALVKQAEEHGAQVKGLQTEFIGKLQEGSDKRHADAERYAASMKELAEKQMESVRELAVTNTEVKNVLVEVRRDIRNRNRGASSPGLDVNGGE